MFSFEESRHALKFNLFWMIHSKTLRNLKSVLSTNFDTTENWPQFYVKHFMRNRVSARLTVEQLSAQLLPLSQTVRQLRNRVSKLSSSKTRSTTLKPWTKQSPKWRIPKKKFFHQRWRRRWNLRKQWQIVWDFKKKKSCYQKKSSSNYSTRQFQLHLVA